MSDAPSGVPPARLQWRDARVDGRPAVYATAGDGPPAVFLHGWALSQRSYRGVLDRLAHQGMRVYAPALPGFGGTSELPRHQRSLRGYARWLIQFLDMTGVADPVTSWGTRSAAESPSRLRTTGRPGSNGW